MLHKVPRWMFTCTAQGPVTATLRQGGNLSEELTRRNASGQCDKRRAVHQLQLGAAKRAEPMNNN